MPCFTEPAEYRAEDGKNVDYDTDGNLSGVEIKWHSRLTERAISRRQWGRNLHLDARFRATDQAKRSRSGEATRGRLHCVIGGAPLARHLKRNEVLHAPIGWDAKGGPSYHSNKQKPVRHSITYRWTCFPLILLCFIKYEMLFNSLSTYCIFSYYFPYIARLCRSPQKVKKKAD